MGKLARINAAKRVAFGTVESMRYFVTTHASAVGFQGDNMPVICHRYDLSVGDLFEAVSASVNSVIAAGDLHFVFVRIMPQTDAPPTRGRFDEYEYAATSSLSWAPNLEDRLREALSFIVKVHPYPWGEISIRPDGTDESKRHVVFATKSEAEAVAARKAWLKANGSDRTSCSSLERLNGSGRET